MRHYVLIVASIEANTPRGKEGQNTRSKDQLLGTMPNGFSYTHGRAKRQRRMSSPDDT